MDVAVCKAGLAASREKAKAMIAAGAVYVDGRQADKSGMAVNPQAAIEIRGETLPFVSRGGLKLDKAVKAFGLTLAGKVCMDVGASHGGFTDCMLQNGARRVYAVDVGSDQLADSLRADPRVVCMEHTNIRHVTPDQIGEAVDFASVDVSFISLTQVLPAVCPLVKADGEIVCLIKPQFEAGRGRVGKKGVVRDPSVHAEVIRKILGLAESLRLHVTGLDWSPIRGPEGNIEYLIRMSRAEAGGAPFCADVRELVKAAQGAR